MGSICMAWRPRKCDILRSPCCNDQFKIGIPAPPSASPTVWAPWAPMIKPVNPNMTKYRMEKRNAQSNPGLIRKSLNHVQRRSKRVQAVEMAIETPMIPNMMPSNGVFILKWLKVPRTAWTRIQLNSKAITPTFTQANLLKELYNLRGMKVKYQENVKKSMPALKPNFIGFMNALIPRTVVSTLNINSSDTRA